MVSLYRIQSLIFSSQNAGSVLLYALKPSFVPLIKPFDCFFLTRNFTFSPLIYTDFAVHVFLTRSDYLNEIMSLPIHSLSIRSLPLSNLNTQLVSSQGQMIHSRIPKTLLKRSTTHFHAHSAPRFFISHFVQTGHSTHNPWALYLYRIEFVLLLTLI